MLDFGEVEEFLDPHDPVLIIAVLGIIVLILISRERLVAILRCIFEGDQEEEPEGELVATLSEYCSIVPGKSYSGKHIDKKGVKLLGIGTVIEGGGFNSENARDYSGNYQDSQILRPGDTYIALTSLTEITRLFLGSPAVVPEDFDGIGITTHHVGKVVFDADPEFVSFCKWMFRSERFRQFCMYMCSGTTVFAVKPDDVLEFPVPSKLSSRQRTLLKSLDEVGKLEHSIIKGSEAQGRLMWSIFRFRFIDFEGAEVDGSTLVDSEIGTIHEDCSVGRLEDYLEVCNHPTKPGVHLSDRQYVPIDCIDRNSLSLVRWDDWSEAASSLILFEKDDLLFGAMRAYFHKVAIAPFSGVTRTTCFVLRPKNSAWLPFCTMLLNLDSTVRYASDSSLGSTMPYAVWEGALARLRVVAPPESMIDDYSRECMPMLESIRDSGLRLNRCRRVIDNLVRELSMTY
mgnify:CR=1 FL=1